MYLCGKQISLSRQIFIFVGEKNPTLTPLQDLKIHSIEDFWFMFFPWWKCATPKYRKEATKKVRKEATQQIRIMFLPTRNFSSHKHTLYCYLIEFSASCTISKHSECYKGRKQYSSYSTIPNENFLRTNVLLQNILINLPTFYKTSDPLTRLCHLSPSI